jgi:WD40 repeat protein
MRRFLLILALVMLSFLTTKAQLIYDWGNWIGPGGVYHVNRIRTDAQGNHYICGTFKDPLDLDPSEGSVIITPRGDQENGFMAKYSPEGELLWHHVILSDRLASVGDVAINSEGNVLIIGNVQFGAATLPGYGSYTLNGAHDAVLISFTADGTYRWARGLTGTSGAGTDTGIELATDSQGNFYATALIYGSSVSQTIGSSATYQFLPNGFSSGVAISKWNDNGVLQYVTGVSSNNPRMAVNPQGEVFLSFPAAQFTFGPQQGESYGTSRLLATKINANGTLAWYRNLANGNNVRSFGLATDGDNAYMSLSIFGSEGNFVSIGGKDLGVVRVNGRTGNVAWVRSIGSSTTDDEGRALAFSPDGNLWVTGFFRGEVDADPSPSATQLVTSRGSTDLILWELNTNGNYQSHYTLGGSNGDEGRSITFDPEGNLLLMGYTANLRTGDFDPGPANRPITNNINAFAGYFTARYTPGIKVSLGPDVVQCGGSVTLTAEPPGYNYLWFNGANTQSITFFNSVNAHVEVYDNNNQLIGTDTVSVIIDNSTSAELGEDRQRFFREIIEPVALGDNYLWSTGETTRSITVNESGTYSLQMDNLNGCPLYDEVEVIIEEPEIYLGGEGDGHGLVKVNNIRPFFKSSTGDGAVNLLHNSTKGGFFAAGVGDGSSQLNLTAAMNRIYASDTGDGFSDAVYFQSAGILFFDSGFGDGHFSSLLSTNRVSPFASGLGDGAAYSQIELIISALENGQLKSDFYIYPNPAKELVSIKYEKWVSNNSYDVLDTKGTLILQGKLTNEVTEIDLIGLSAGTYLIRIHLVSGKVEHGKLIKK